MPATSWPHAVTTLARVWSRTCSRLRRCCASVSLDCRISEYSGAALIDRHRKLRDRRGAELAVKRQRLLVGLLHRALQRDRRQQRAFAHLDLEEADIDAEHRRGDVRIFGQAEIDRARQRPRQKAVDRRTRRERLRLVADDAAEIRFGRDQVGFGGQQLGPAGGQLRLRLRDVGAGHFADVEAIAGLLQGLFENADVAL